MAVGTSTVRGMAVGTSTVRAEPSTATPAPAPPTAGAASAGGPSDRAAKDPAAPEVIAPEVLASDPAAPDPAAREVGGPEVMAQLALVVRAAGPGGFGALGSQGALRVVEAVEAIKAWADSVALEATAVMVGELETDFVHLAPQRPSAAGWARFAGMCRSAAAREIQVATGLPISRSQRLVWLASCERQRVGALVGQMRGGRVSLARVEVLAEATAHLDASTAATIGVRVLRPLSGPDGVPLPGVAPLSQATFRSRLHRQLVLHHGLVREAQRSYAEALKARRLSAEPHHDGTGVLFLSGDGARISAATARVDQIARRLRRRGDERTLAQLRADVATDLLLRGWIPNDPTFARLGTPPEATVSLIVSLTTLLGLDRGVAPIPGWGAVNAEQARALALAAGSIWRRVVTDPLTGRAIEATAGTYRVPAAMAQQVSTRDGTCRAPGCEIPAAHADLDHTLEWASQAADTSTDNRTANNSNRSGGTTNDGTTNDGTTTTRNSHRNNNSTTPGNSNGGPNATGGAGGVTAETNLTALHRGHHNLKTAGFWDSDQSPDGTLVWTTATGRKVTTYPYVYDHPDNLPVGGSHLEAQLGGRLAGVINPAIPLPGHLSIFDEIGWAATLAPAVPAPPPHLWPTPLTNKTPAPSSTSKDQTPPPF